MASGFRREKQRHEVAIQRFASPLRDAAPSELERFWQMQHTYARATNAHWDDGGPCNFAGRATCLAVDSRDPMKLFAGSAAGGLWRSIDGGANWTSCWPNALNQNIGAVSLDPEGSIVCATGEGNLATASYPGSGIYKSSNEGLSWHSYVWQPGKRRMSPKEREKMPRRVASMAYSAKNESGCREVAIGSISNDEQLLGGLVLSRHGVLSFVDHWSSRPYNCYSAVFHPTDPGVLYAGIEAGGAINGIWRTTDGGATWEQLTEGLPPGEECGRISIAISPKDPRVLHALISDRNQSEHGRVRGVYRSKTGGDSWEVPANKEARTLLAEQKQLSYNNAIAIHPDNPGTVVLGAQGLFLSEDEGVNWVPISSGNRAITPTKGNPGYVHPDHHAIVMIPGSRTIYSANDGGVARSDDLGGTWSDASHGMNTVMFYAIDVSSRNSRIYGGGAQDNGTLMAGVKDGVGLRSPSEGPQPFVQVLTGDGGYVVCDPAQEEMVFASLFSTETRYHEPHRRWARGLFADTWRDASPRIKREESEVLGLTVMAIKPGADKGAGQLLLGTNRLWQADYLKTGKGSAGKEWVWRTSEFSQFDGSAISAIDVATADPAVIFVGTADGGIFLSKDGGDTWSEDLAGPDIPKRVITQIETHPRRPGTVVVTVASTGLPAAAFGGRFKAYSHVFRSEDFGQRWDDIDNGQLPNVVFNGLAYETDSPFRLFVAGDAGPWVLESDGRWVSIAGNIPSAVISDIIYHRKTRTLFAGTYGRGIWRMKVPRQFKRTAGKKGVNVEKLLPQIEGHFLDGQVPVPTPSTPAAGAQAGDGAGLATFSCSAVTGARGYVFEAESGNLSDFSRWMVTTTRHPSVAMVLPFSRGSVWWRCWALMPDGRCSFPSSPVKFKFRG